MHPVFCKGLAIGSLGLGNLILMMRENKILAACMDINLFSQIFLTHDRALNVPSGTALTPGRLPVRFAVFFGLPEYEIQRVLFLILTGHQKRTITALQIIQILVGQLAILLKASGAEIYSTVSCSVGMPFFNQSLDHIKHSADFLSSLWMGGGGFYIQ